MPPGKSKAKPRSGTETSVSSGGHELNIAETSQRQRSESPISFLTGPQDDSPSAIPRKSTNNHFAGSSRHGPVRSRTSTISYTRPLAPVMSRENSLEEVSQDGSELPGPSRLVTPSTSRAGKLFGNRRASKSVSNAKPPTNNSPFPQGTAPIPSLLVSPDTTLTQREGAGKRMGLKRRISTPIMTKRSLPDTGDVDTAGTIDEGDEGKSAQLSPDQPKEVQSRARSTSTSIVVPQHLQERHNATAGPSSAPMRPPSPYRTHGIQPLSSTPSYITPSTPEETTPPYVPNPTYPNTYTPSSAVGAKSRSAGLLSSMYDASEASLLKLTRWVRPKTRTDRENRRDSDVDSEKGLEEDEPSTGESRESTIRTSVDSSRRDGSKYWWNGSTGHGSDEDEAEHGYFSLPPTPPEDKANPMLEFESALTSEKRAPIQSLPTPALSTRSLSRVDSKSRRKWAGPVTTANTQDGWLALLYRSWGRLVASGGNTGKTGEVMKELGWTVGFLVALFFVTGLSVLWSVKGLPITQLKHLPTSTSDLQLLSAEIRGYMASSPMSWWHTVGVLTVVGCWKHAWSVPGAVVLNILVGSVLEPMSALALLTIITATGSLFSYLLSRPLAPLIAVLFPKPLALVRAALAPDSAPPPTVTHPSPPLHSERVTPVTTDTPPSGSVWRRLLIMRAMGFVPWSGMNVACGVVGVDWKVFWITTAAGSASWSYVTASVGNILSRLAIPSSALDDAATAPGGGGGESLTSLLRDPVLIAKLVFLSGLTLLPVVLKKRKGGADPHAAVPGEKGDPPNDTANGAGEILPPALSPDSPLASSLARFTPTPAMFDLLSFGRTAMRTTGAVVMGAVRGGVAAGQRVAGLGR